jgi:hypothetical protein
MTGPQVMNAKPKTTPFPPFPWLDARMAWHVLDRRWRAEPDRFASNEEPSLDDLLADPLTRSLMASDGLRHESLMAEIEGLRARLAGA